MPVKFEQNRMVTITQTFELLDRKVLTIFDKAIDAILEDISVDETIFDAELLIWRLPSFSVPNL